MTEEFVKIVVFVPTDFAFNIRQVIGDAEAGKIGNYTHSSFSTKGTGRFKPQQGAHPAIGKVGKLEEVEEERVEVICLRNKASKVIEAIRKVHPYEEVALDIYLLINEKDL